jgi:hypothetical protein
MRVLIISPHFPPTNSADMHRVRLLLPYFEMYGWEVEVLAVDPAQVNSPQDVWLEEGLPAHVEVHRIAAVGLKWSKIPGLGTLGFRSLHALGKRGDELLSGKRFDLIYFSTTVFETHLLGPRWKRKYGLPFIMDFQDPWVSDYYREHPEVVPPGGRVKYAVIDRLHHWMEPRVFRECLGMTAVSPAYLPQLLRRYPDCEGKPSLVIPFPGDPGDLKRAEECNVSQPVFRSDDGLIHWVYAGVVIPAMHGTLRAFFRAVVKGAQPSLLERLRIHFVGTNYVPATQAQPVVTPIAAEYGLQAYVVEHPARIPYSEMLSCLRQANALLVIGSNDAGYTASKIYPYLLARRPLLSIFHEASSIITLLDHVHGSVCVPFGDDFEESRLATAIEESWLSNRQYEQVTPLNETAFAPYTASEQARQLAEFFRATLRINRHDSSARRQKPKSGEIPLEPSLNEHE